MRTSLEPSLVALGGDAGVNLFLIGADDGDVAIVSGDAEVGASADLVGLGPVVSAGWELLRAPLVRSS